MKSKQKMAIQEVDEFVSSSEIKHYIICSPMDPLRVQTADKSQ